MSASVRVSDTQDGVSIVGLEEGTRRHFQE